MRQFTKNIGAAVAAAALLASGIPAGAAMAQEGETDTENQAQLIEYVAEQVDQNAPVDLIGDSRSIDEPEDQSPEIVAENGVGAAAGEILVNAKKDYSDTASMDAFAASLGQDTQYEVVASGRTFTLIRFKFSGMSFDDAIAKATESGMFESATPNFAMKQEDTSSNISVKEAEVSKYWDEEQLNWKGAWELMPKNRTQVAVAVIDSGVESTNKDLTGRVLDGYNIHTKGTDTEDLTGHGTQAASVIAGNSDDNFGHDGGSYDAKIYPVQVRKSANDETVVLSDLAVALAYLVGSEPNTSGVGKSLKQISEDSPAKKNNIRVANISFSSDARYADDAEHESQYSQPLKILEPVIAEALTDYGMATVVASGNAAAQFGGAYEALPGDCPSAVNVIATNSEKKRSAFSNYNMQATGGAKQEYLKDISAPGERIAMAISGNRETVNDGTSFAAPQVSALLALMASSSPNSSMEELINVVYGTAEDLGAKGTDVEFGHGLISPASAMSKLSVLSQLSAAKVSIDGSNYADFKYTKTEYAFVDTEKDKKHTIEFTLPDGWKASEPVSDLKLTPSEGNNPETAVQTMTVKVSHSETGTEKTYTFQWNWTGKVNLGNSGANIEIPEMIFDGKPSTPLPTIKIGDVVLTEGVDYTLSYSNNDKVGTGKMTITGIGNYEGSIVADFPIKAAANENANTASNENTGGTTANENGNSQGAAGESQTATANNEAKVVAASTNGEISKTADQRPWQIAGVFSLAAMIAAAAAAVRRSRLD